MVQENTIEDVSGGHSLKVTPLAGVDINDVAARLQSRGDVSDDIFEIIPRFSISPGEREDKENAEYSVYEKDGTIKVLATAGTGDVTGIAIGCELVIFERDKDEPSKHLTFSASIDFVVWRRSIMLIGLSSSEIMLVDPSYYDIKHKWKLSANCATDKKFFVDAFIHSNPNPTKLDVIVVSACGIVCRFPDVSLSVGSLDATHDQNVSLDVDLGTVKEITRKLEISDQIVCAASPSRNRLIVVEKSGRTMVVDLDEADADLQSAYVVSDLYRCLNEPWTPSSVPQKVVLFNGAVFVLLSNGILKTFVGGDMLEKESLTLPSPSMVVYDFALVMNSERVVKLWVLYGHQRSCENYVGIFSGPQFASEFIFKLPVLHKIGDHLNFRFPCHVSPFEEPVSIVEMSKKTVKLYHMLETSTDVTLQKLLSRGKYIEAEDLAKNYNKDLDIVRKSEARDKLNRLTSSHLSLERKVCDTSFQDLLDVLTAIKDAEFVCNFCVHTQLPKVEWVKQILALGKSRVPECPTTQAAKHLLLTIKKFYTFELVYPLGSITEWNALIAEDNTMFLQSIKFLQNGNFDKCEKVWRRHSDEFVPFIQLGEFLQFFNILFVHQLKTPESISLLKTILPFAVAKVAHSGGTVRNMEEGVGMELGVLISIILRQVSALESKIDWPVNALCFVEVLSKVIGEEIKRCEVLRTSSESAAISSKNILQSISSRLDKLQQILEELAELKKNHSIRILFSDYTKNEIPEVVNNLLYNLLSKEEVESFVSEFLRPFALRKGLNTDHLFAEHIKSVLQDIPYFIQAINIPHEERIICLVHLMESHKIKLQCTLQISEEWPVPWTAGIDSMVKNILDSYTRASFSGDDECKRLFDNICIMRKQVPYRCVLSKYKLTSSKLLKYGSNVTMALLKILKAKKPGFYEDCRELLKNIPSSGWLDDDARLEFLKFTLRMYDNEVPEEETFSDKLNSDQKLQKALIHRINLELQRSGSSDCLDPLCTPEEQKRLVAIFGLLALKSNNSKIAVLARLKQFLPNTSLDIIHHPEFPYIVLNQMLEDWYSKQPDQLIKDCKTLSRITETYFPDVLITAGAYFTQQGLSGNPGAVLWTLVEYIMKSPLNIDINNSSINQELLQSACFDIAHYLMLQCNSLSFEQMETLKEFLCRISNSFDKLCEEVGQMLCYFRIFLCLKEQEIPLENEFMIVYKWLAVTGGRWEQIKGTLKMIGETLLKFGETDIYCSVFRTVKRNMHGLRSRSQDEAYVNHFTHIITEIEQMKDDLTGQSSQVIEMKEDRGLLKLVHDLNAAGIRVNAYALKIRNKVKLLLKLLHMKNYTLAAQLAITFDFYEDQEIWSQILRGFIVSGNMEELQRVLESIRTITQLWMLPEFSDAWKKVSEQDSTFMDMCPIPLD